MGRNEGYEVLTDSANLHSAKRRKNDEFYTQLKDIEIELIRYKDYFKGKSVYCNCDDGKYSQFWKYFYDNFECLGLTRLVATHFKMFEPVYKYEITQANQEPIITKLRGNGDFRGPECFNILKGVDVMVTNPPFSLFRDYIIDGFEFNKDFIVIGNPTSMSYKEVFEYIQKNRLFVSQRGMEKNMLFDVPNDFRDYLLSSRKEKSSYVMVDGVVKARAMATWFSNIYLGPNKQVLNIDKKYNPQDYKKYNPQDYKKYDNYDAINVDSLAKIPCDYYEEMGVPITFLYIYDPAKFDIIRFRKGRDNKDLRVDGKDKFTRVIIKRKLNH